MIPDEILSVILQHVSLFFAQENFCCVLMFFVQTTIANFYIRIINFDADFISVALLKEGVYKFLLTLNVPAYQILKKAINIHPSIEVPFLIFHMFPNRIFSNQHYSHLI